MYKCALCTDEFMFKTDFILHQHAMHPIEKGDIKNVYSILAQQQKLLEKMNKQLRMVIPYMNRVRKKFNQCQYLNHKYGTMKSNFNDFLNNIIADGESFRYIISDNLASGMYDVLEKNLESYKEKDNLPIRCFNMKKNVFYIYTGTEWRKMTAEEDNLLMCKSRSKLDEYFNLYFNRNIDMNGMTMDVSQMVQKMCGGGVGKMDKTRKRVRKKLFNYLKLNEKQIIEVEFY